MALNDAKYGRLADLQTIQQTATIRQAKRKSLHAVSRRSSSSAFSVAQDPNYMPIDDLVLAVEADGYNSPVVQEAGRSNGACGQCRAVFTLIKAPHPCLLACGKLFCSDCLVQICGHQLTSNRINMTLKGRAGNNRLSRSLATRLASSEPHAMRVIVPSSAHQLPPNTMSWMLTSTSPCRDILWKKINTNGRSPSGVPTMYQL
jgi:hypothetical protein